LISHKNPSFLGSWVLVIASTLVTLGVWGTSGSFGVFLKPIVEELGLTRAMASGAVSIVMITSGLIGIVAGRLTDKYGARILLPIGAFIGGLGYLMMYQASSLWQLYLYFGVLFGVCMGLCWTPILANISRWFSEKRVQMLGITTSGITLGQMSIPILAAYTISVYGWRSAYILLAIIVWMSVIPIVILLNKKGSQVPMPEGNRVSENVEIINVKTPKMWSVGKAIKTLPFWMLMVTGFVTATGFYFIQVHIVAYATDLEVATTSAALILTIMNVGSLISQLLVWVLVNKMGSRFTVIICLALQALALFFLIGVHSLLMFCILGVVFGIGFGGGTTVRMSMVSEFFGTSSVGMILGLVTTAWSVGGIVGPILAGYIFDISHSYNIAFLIGGILLTVGTISGFFLMAPKIADYKDNLTGNYKL
jgi:MFS family permease